MTCKNCNQDISDNYCQSCGQKASVQRINLPYLLNEIPESLFQLNHGLFFTIKELIMRPGHSLREFLAGKRVHHYKPIAFILVTSAFYILIALTLDQKTNFDDALTGVKEAILEFSPDEDFKFINWMIDKQVYLPFLMIPLFSLASFFSFRKYSYNYVEHLLINIYISGQKMIINVCFGLLFFKNENLPLIALIVGVLYTFWAFNQLFNQKKLSSNLSKISLTYFIFSIMLLFIIAVLGLTIKSLS